MNQDDHDKLTRIDVTVQNIEKSVDKLTLFMGAAPCSQNSQRLTKIENTLTWTIRAFVLAVAGFIGKKLTGF